MKKLNYCSGDCFIVPLRSGGFARGLVVRLNGKGRVFGYFFGPIIAARSVVIDTADLRPDKAILVCQFGDLGLLKREWKVFGHLPRWMPDEWPMPKFLHIDKAGDMAFFRKYDDNTLKFISEERVPLSSITIGNVPEDGLMGAGFVEIRLTNILA